MIKFLKKLYIHHNFFIWLLLVAGIFIVSFFVDFLYQIANILLLILVFLFLLDILFLFISKENIEGKRILPEKFSNSDENLISIKIKNNFPFLVNIDCIDEIPFQFQNRNFLLQFKIPSKEIAQKDYFLRPTERGVYNFGRLNIFVSTPLKLATRRFIFDENAEIAVYPSFIQMKKYEMMAFSKHLFEMGIKKIRRLGHTMEFEHIRSYVLGDDIRSINWKASSKTASLMVNQYQDEKSQPVYTIIDKGRSMQMPFNGLSLLDYSINTSLALSNIIIKKQDKAGVFLFSKKVEDRVLADRKQTQMQSIMQVLYSAQTNFLESDFSRLYADINQNIKQRSLIMLYTNFETKDSLFRQLPYLKAIAKRHLLVVIFFKNTELNNLIYKKSLSVKDVYDKVIAEKFSFEKRLIVQELSKHGILSILAKPEELSLKSINMYLELKSRGRI